MLIEKQRKFVNRILDNSIQNVFPIFPVQNKYIHYEQINEFIVPTMCKLNGKTISELQRNINIIIASQELLRLTFSKGKDNSNIMKVFKYDAFLELPIYSINTLEEFKILIEDLGKDLMKRRSFDDILYNMCFIEYNGEIYFYGIFSHLIFDGSFDFEKYLLDPNKIPKSTIPVFNKYLDSIDMENYTYQFEKYFYIKKKLIDKYLSDQVINDSLSFHSDKFYKKSNITIEEFWTLTIFKTLFRIFSDFNDIPLNILTNGRKFSNIICSKDFGDFHDEIILLNNKNNLNNIVTDFRKFRYKSYLNSKLYSNLLTYNKKTYSNFIEPFILLISGDFPDIEKHEQLRKSLPKINRKYVLSIRILTKPNFKDFKIWFRYSSKLNDKISLLKSIIIEEANNIINQFEDQNND